MINLNYSRSLLLKVCFKSTNILFTLTYLQGNVIFWTSVGTWKIKGVKKLTLTTIEIALKTVFRKIGQFNCKFLHVELYGFSKNKKVIIRLLKNNCFQIQSINDKTSNPHNGCKKKKIRRI
uniref:Ribosomal protein S11 n=1 Tax=Gelidiella acerosa TaxID=28867 RepID=A0A7G9IVP6_9FLOR|nr:ribosomal protein S11 [Gelidiella acerosa]QNM39440.1 ribosomal protein S11 [Gelidiella acerosa]